jgi:hypothetical protein
MIANTKQLADHLGADPTVRSIQRRIYKDTACGASITIHVWGVEVSSIVEGSDAEVPPCSLAYPFTGDDFDRAVEHVEEVADELWREANEPEKAL